MSLAMSLAISLAVGLAVFSSTKMPALPPASLSVRSAFNSV
jgi:hypothetical protein